MTDRTQRCLAAVALTAALFVVGCVQVPSGAPAPAPAPAGTAVNAPAAAPAPQAVRTGTLQVVQWPVLTIDRKEFRAAPGARIVNRNNLTVTPNQVPPGAKVQYELDGTGQVRLMRLLDPHGGEQVSPPRGPTGSAQ
jgi:hypothetical protein